MIKTTLHNENKKIYQVCFCRCCVTNPYTPKFNQKIWHWWILLDKNVVNTMTAWDLLLIVASKILDTKNIFNINFVTYTGFLIHKLQVACNQVRALLPSHGRQPDLGNSSAVCWKVILCAGHSEDKYFALSVLRLLQIPASVKTCSLGNIDVKETCFC